MWMILNRKKKLVKVRDLKVACECGIIWEKKPDMKKLTSAYFDKRREKLVKIKVSIQAKKKGGKRK